MDTGAILNTSNDPNLRKKKFLKGNMFSVKKWLRSYFLAYLNYFSHVLQGMAQTYINYHIVHKTDRNRFKTALGEYTLLNMFVYDC